MISVCILIFANWWETIPYDYRCVSDLDGTYALLSAEVCSKEPSCTFLQVPASNGWYVIFR